jgi:hypothetical protein
MRRRPPKRRCPRCGTAFYSWADGVLCSLCRRSTQPDRSALVEEIRRRRAERNDAA